MQGVELELELEETVLETELVVEDETDGQPSLGVVEFV